MASRLRRFVSDFPAHIAAAGVWELAKPMVAAVWGTMTVAGLLWFRDAIAGMSLGYRFLFVVPALAILFGISIVAVVTFRTAWAARVASRFPVRVQVAAMGSGAEPWGVHQNFVVRLVRVRVTNSSPDRKVSLEIRLLWGGAGILQAAEGDPRTDLDSGGHRELGDLRFVVGMLREPSDLARFNLRADKACLYITDHLSGESKMFRRSEW